MEKGKIDSKRVLHGRLRHEIRFCFGKTYGYQINL